jgi:ribonuclease P protein component
MRAAYQSLQTQADFSRVRRRGKRLDGAHLSLVAMPAAPQRPPRIGIVAGKPVGGAVERNRARRRIRAALCDVALPRYDLVLTARPSARTVPFDGLQGDLSALLGRLDRR